MRRRKEVRVLGGVVGRDLREGPIVDGRMDRHDPGGFRRGEEGECAMTLRGRLVEEDRLVGACKAIVDRRRRRGGGMDGGGEGLTASAVPLVLALGRAGAGARRRTVDVRWRQNLDLGALLLRDRKSVV